MKGKQIILLVILAIVVAFVFFSVKYADKGKREVAVGLEAPDFSVVDVRTGKKLTSSDLRGKVLFVNFWASWCEPCKEEMPSVDAISKDFASNDKFMMITILYRDTPENAFGYMKSMGYGFPVSSDPGESAAANFGVTGVPETYVIDKKGVLKRKVIGPADWNSPEERGLINALLNE